MDALRIEFHLSTAMQAPVNPIHLDALLAYATTQDKLARGIADPDTPVRSLADDLPLEKALNGDDWAWKASALMADGVLDSWMRMWTRKTDPYAMAEQYLAGQIKSRLISLDPAKPKSLKPYGLSIQTVNGLLKNHFQFYPVQKIEKFTAWCVGDGDEIEYLLKDSGYVRHIGAKSRIDHGRITEVRIVDDPDALSKWRYRILPWQEEDLNVFPVQAGLRAPYWAEDTVGQGFVPMEIVGF